MFAFDRETATLVAAVLCVAATIYIYNEFKKNRQDMEFLRAEYEKGALQ